MVEGEDGRAWPVDALMAFVDGGLVSTRDRQARRVRVPAILRETAELPLEPRWAGDVGKLHRSCQVAAAKMWWEALGDPGRVHTTPVLADYEGSWHDAELSYLNLLHQPEIEAVVVVLRVAQPATDIPTIEEVQDPGFEAPTWILQELDSVGTIVRSDGMVKELFGRSAEELEGRSILGFLHPDDYDAALSMWLDLMEQPETTRTLRVRLLHPDDSVIWIESTVMRRADVDGQPSVVIVSHDVSDRRAREKALRHQAATDLLTGLLNRRALEDRLADVLAKADGGVTVAFVDLDGFKTVNDEAGHDAGDRVLAELGARLAGETGPDLLAARWGGDEFVLVSTDPAGGPDKLTELVERVLLEPVVLRERSWRPAASIGVARGGPGDDPADVLRRADQAMYEHKRQPH